MQFEQIGQQFVDHYYATFDSDRSRLSALYAGMHYAHVSIISYHSDNSMLTFGGERLAGRQAIVQKLVSLPFQQVRHEVLDKDFQPNPATNGVVILVTGELINSSPTRI